MPPEVASLQGSHTPHPIVFKPPLVDSVQSGESLDLGLTLVGKALDYLPYVVLSIRELGRRGMGRERVGFEVVHLVCTRTGQEVDLDRPTTSRVEFNLDPSANRPLRSNGPEPFQILLKTPLRLKYNNQRMFHFAFRPFIAAAIRRLELLALWHCGVDTFGSLSDLLGESDKARLISDRTCFRDWIRFSKRQGQRMPVGGILGHVVLEGEYDVFSELFDAARYLNVGNQTSFGLGQVDFQRLT
ncbi:MAG: CRISPR system precrRNA processing endoribonuclease RAMP protein Cas6 [Desulfomonilaceae bacterium]